MPDISYVLPSGATIEVESSRTLAGSGVEQASAVGELVKRGWSEAMEVIGETGNQMVLGLSSLKAQCKEISVEFNVAFDGKFGIKIVEGAVKANLKVTLKL